VTARQRANQTAFDGGPDDNTTRAEIEGSEGKKAREDGGREHTRLGKRANRLEKHLYRGRNVFVRGYCWDFVPQRTSGHHSRKGNTRRKEGRRARPVPLVWGEAGHAATKPQHATLCGMC